MKMLYEKISSNGRQILEIVILAVLACIPWIINLQELFKDYLLDNPISPDNFLWQIALRYGKPIASVIILVSVLVVVRRFNQGFVMNRKLVYHDYSYAWYWFCAKILGITACDLVLVPIYMQFKLVIRATFLEYPLDETEYPVVENETESMISELNHEKEGREVNLILEDTYSIEHSQIPKTKQEYRTIKISRNNGVDGSRHFSQQYIDEMINYVRGLNDKVVINVFSTTSPFNTLHIAKRVFGLGERGNIEHLYVFQQSKDGARHFEENGRKIY